MSHNVKTPAIWVLALLLGTALVAELGIMLVLDRLSIESSFLRALIDAVALFLLLAPVVYFVVVKKLLEIPAIRLSSTLLGSALLAELAIMLILDYLPIEDVLLRALIDSVVLAGLLSPVVYYLIVRSILDQNVELKRSRDELELARSHLEQRVKERTAELEGVNETLAASVARLSARNVQSKALSDMSQMLQSSLTPGEACSVAEKQLASVLAGASFDLYLLNESRTLLERVGSERRPGERRESFAPEECWALRRNKPHLFNVDSPRSIACDHEHGVREGWHLCLPLMAQGMALGVLCLEPMDSIAGIVGSRASDPDADFDFYASVAEVLALAIANVNLRESLRHQALRDSLTGLVNRRYITDALDRELARAIRSGESLSVVMLDIDFFKRFNDTFGHDAGDAVLRTLGTLLRKRARAEDIACRYGGEEFMLVMTGMSSDAAQNRVDVLREEIQALDVQHEGRSLGRITVSAGIATYPLHAQGKKELIEAADQALYSAKHAGRNRVTIAAPGRQVCEAEYSTVPTIAELGNSPSSSENTRTAAE